VTPFRSVLHGTCLVGGRHPVGSKLAKECPVLRHQARQGKAAKAGILGTTKAPGRRRGVR